MPHDDGEKTTTVGPPPTYNRQRSPPGVSIASSSQLSPKSPGEEPRPSSGRRKSNVTFGGQTSVAPSSSISKVIPRAPRTLMNKSTAETQYSQTTRRRSAPWQDVDYRSSYPSKAGSSQGGTARSGNQAPLTETNLEVFNESRPTRTEAVTERDVEIEQSDRKSSRRSRRDSGVATQTPQSSPRSVGAETKRTTRKYSQPEDQSKSGYASKTAMTSRRGTEVNDDGDDDDETETKTRTQSGFASYSRPTLSSRSKSNTKVTTRSARASDVYTQAAERRGTGPTLPEWYTRSKTGSSYQPRAATMQSGSSIPEWYTRSQAGTASRSRAATMPPESDSHASTEREIAIVGGGVAAAAAASQVSRRTATTARKNEQSSRRIDVECDRKSYYEVEERTTRGGNRSESSSSQHEATTAKQTSVAADRSAAQTLQPSQAPSRSEQPSRAEATTPPNEPSQVPTSATSATSPTSPTSPDESQWERRVRIREIVMPNGRVIEDRESWWRRISPQVAA